MKTKLKVFILVTILAIVQTIAISYALAQEEPVQKNESAVSVPQDSKQSPGPKIEFEGRYWRPALSGSVKAVSANIGSGIDIKDDLGLKNEGIPEGKFTWYTGPSSSLRLSYFQVGYDGDNRLERTIQFKGKEFTAGTNVQTNADIKDAKLGWAWQFINLANGKIKLGTLLEASLVNVTYTIKNTSGLIDEKQSFMAPVPAIGCALDVAPWKWMDLFLDLSGLPLGSYGHTFNVETGIKFVPITNFSIVCGYRYFDLDYENKPDFLKVKLSGPFVGATLRF